MLLQDRAGKSEIVKTWLLRLKGTLIFVSNLEQRTPLRHMRHMRRGRCLLGMLEMLTELLFVTEGLISCDFDAL